MEECRSGIRAISRSLAVLRAINRADSMSIIEIARAASIPYPTARRITHTLVKEGYLERETTRKCYRPTVLVKALAQGYREDSALLEIARPHLVGLTRDHLWPVSLVTRVGQLMIVRDCTHSLSPVALSNYSAGTTFPLLECASGHCYLAFSTEEERQQLLRAAAEGDEQVDPLLIRPFQIGTAVAQIQEAGFAHRGRNRFTDTPGRTSSIAAPIFQDEHIFGALTMVMVANAMTMNEAAKRYAPLLKAAARQISQALAVGHDQAVTVALATPAWTGDVLEARISVKPSGVRVCSNMLTSPITGRRQSTTVPLRHRQIDR